MFLLPYCGYLILHLHVLAGGGGVVITLIFILVHNTDPDIRVRYCNSGWWIWPHSLTFAHGGLVGRHIKFLYVLSITHHSMIQLVSVLPGLLMGTTSCTPVPPTATGRSSPHAAGNQWEGLLKLKAAVLFSVSTITLVSFSHTSYSW